MKTFQQLIEDEKRMNAFMDNECDTSSVSTFKGDPHFNLLNDSSLQQSTTKEITNLRQFFESRKDIATINDKFKYKHNASFQVVSKWQQDAYSVYASSNSSVSSFNGSICSNIEDAICKPASQARQRILDWTKNNPQESICGSTIPQPTIQPGLLNNSTLNRSDNNHLFKVPQVPNALQSKKSSAHQKAVSNIHDWHFCKGELGFYLGGKRADPNGKVRSWRSRNLNSYNLLNVLDGGLSHKSLIHNDRQIILHLGVFQPTPEVSRHTGTRHPKHIIESFKNGFPEDWKEILDDWKQYILQKEPIDFVWQQRINVPVDKEFSLNKFKTDPTNDIESAMNTSTVSPSINFDTNDNQSAAKLQNQHKPSLEKVNDSSVSTCINFKINDNPTAAPLQNQHKPSLQKRFQNGSDSPNITGRPFINVGNSKNDISQLINVSTKSVLTESAVKSPNRPSPKLPLKPEENNSVKKDIRKISLGANLSVVRLPKTAAEVDSSMTKDTNIQLPAVLISKTKQPTIEISSCTESTQKLRIENEHKLSQSQNFKRRFPEKVMHLSNWWPTLVRRKDGEYQMFLQGNLAFPDGKVFEEHHTTKCITKHWKSIVTTKGQCYTIVGGIDTRRIQDIPACVVKRMRFGFPNSWKFVTRMWSQSIETSSPQKIRKKGTENKNREDECNPILTSSGSNRDHEVLKQSRSGRILTPVSMWWTLPKEEKNECKMETAEVYSSSEYLEHSSRKRCTQSKKKKATSGVKTVSNPSKYTVKSCPRNVSTQNSKQTDQTENQGKKPKKPKKGKEKKVSTDVLDYQTLKSKLTNGRPLNQREQYHLEEWSRNRRQLAVRQPDMFTDIFADKDQLEDFESDESIHCPDIRKVPCSKKLKRIGTPETKYRTAVVPTQAITPVSLPALTTKERKDIIAYGRERNASLKKKPTKVDPRPKKKCSESKSQESELFDLHFQVLADSQSNLIEDEFYSDLDSRLNWDAEDN